MIPLRMAFARNHGQQRVVSQFVMIIQIFIAQGDAIDPLPQ